jgi:hypothetical protein
VADPLFRTIFCADWAKPVSGREVYRADVPGRAVAREPPPKGGWTVSELMKAGMRRRRDGPVLIGFDAPLGVPKSYLDVAISTVPEWAGCKGFVDWLLVASQRPAFFSETADRGAWSLESPFFVISKKGRLLWEKRARSLGVESLREIDKLTGAKSVFVVSGIPGSVGSAARDIWQGLVPFLKEPSPSVAVWPFKGTLEELAGSEGVVVGEIYPRAAYANALSPKGPNQRAPMALAKSKCRVRRQALDQLVASTWVTENAVRVADLEEALDSDDAFDALLTAAALLRCVLEGTSLESALSVAAEAEGGILGAGSLQLRRRV